MTIEMNARQALDVLDRLLGAGALPSSHDGGAADAIATLSAALDQREALRKALAPFVTAYADMPLEDAPEWRQNTMLDCDGSYAAGSDLTQEDLFVARAALAPPTDADDWTQAIADWLVAASA